MNNTVKTKILKNGNKLVVIVINNEYEYAPKYSDLREVIIQLKKIYGAKEVKKELKLGQYDKEKTDQQIVNEKQYGIEERKRLIMLSRELEEKRKTTLRDFSKSSVFNY